MQEEQSIQLKSKKGPELLQVTSDGEKPLISGKGYLQVRDCSDLSWYTDLTDRVSGRKSNLGFLRCVQDFPDGQLLISGHDDPARRRFFRLSLLQRDIISCIVLNQGCSGLIPRHT
jgi:hypothetical protein